MAAAPAPPKAATTVLNGQVTEREIKMQKELEEERQARKKEQTRLSELEDENRRLKTPAQPAKAKGLTEWDL